MKHKRNLTVILLLCAFGTSAAQAALVLEYVVDIVEPGPVALGSTINWQLSASVSGTPDSGGNFGIAALSVNLSDSLSETLSPGTISPAFSGYDLDSGGTFLAPDLRFIGALQDQQGASTVGVNTTGTFLLATGSYVVTTPGIHTLQASEPPGVDSSYYFTAALQNDFNASEYGQITFGSDTVTAIPEPSGVLMIGLVVAAGLSRRLLPKFFSRI